MKLFTPIARISLGLVFATVGMLLVGELLGLVPDEEETELTARKVIAETLAVQLATQYTRSDITTLQNTLDALVSRSPVIRSAGVRRDRGDLLVSAGPHQALWKDPTGAVSTPLQIKVPIFQEGQPWGRVETVFEPLPRFSLLTTQRSFFGLLLFIGLSCYFVYVLFLRKALEALNPARVIPQRVRAALDSLTEGLVIVDDRERIVLANQSFSQRLGVPVEKLIGRRASELGWSMTDQQTEEGLLPWVAVLKGLDAVSGSGLTLRTPLRETYSFKVNATAITGPGQQIRGALATFDDISLLERKHRELQRALRQLESSQDEINRKNRELQVLATRDALTGCLNRRALFESFGMYIAAASKEGDELSCIMLDIDHFKRVNDTYGHATGDQVIALLGRILRDVARAEDLVGRYGGEEFCLVLPRTTAVQAGAIAERIRATVETAHTTEYGSPVAITSSFGVCALPGEMMRAEDLVARADEALYAAKQNGRNRVFYWGIDGTQAVAGTQDAVPTASQPVQKPTRTAPALDGDRSLVSLGNHAAAVVTDAMPEALAESIEMESGGEMGIALVEGARERRPDVVADLPGDVLFLDRVTQASLHCRRSGQQLALLVVGMNTHHSVADDLSTELSEQIAAVAAERLGAVFRRTDTVGWLGSLSLDYAFSRIRGSELVVLLTDLKHAEGLTWIVGRILAALAGPMPIAGGEIYAAATVGISVFPDDGEDAANLVKKAIRARRSLEREGARNGYRFHSEELDRKSKAQVEIETKLSRAVEHDELLVHYQPKVSLETGAVSGMEALLRWEDPERGQVAPRLFIPIAEHVGLITKIGEQLLRTVLMQVREWRDSGFTGLRVSVNVSPVELRQLDYAERVLGMIADLGLDPSSLEVEVTESSALESGDAALGSLRALTDAGVGLAIDDFGTGYASLKNLTRLGADTLKIDCSFISGMTHNEGDASIVSAVMSMAHSLGLKVVAEGVETEEQLNFLKDLRCDSIQGAIVSEAVPRTKATELLADKAKVRRKIKPRPRLVVDPDQRAPAIYPIELCGILNDAPRRVGER